MPELTGLGPIPFQPGQLIHGRYEILHVIGAGGVGFVMTARHAGFDDLVALKFLRPEFTSNAEAVTRFTIEARASFKLRSEHVVRMLDVDICEGTPFIAMELLEGTDLRRVLARYRVLELEPAVDYMLQACEALSAAHALGVIHRDIKPENLFLLGEGAEGDHLKVLDFGISKVALVSSLRATNQALTRVAVGTPPYMSPEQVRASRDLDMRSDLWSVGCVLYELVTGSAPFERESLMQACAAVLEEEPLPPRQLRPAIPSGLSDAIMRCLRKSPADRFNDVAELADALGPYGSGRLSAYPARCRANLNGEGPGRRSTPTAIAAVRRTGSMSAAAEHTGSAGKHRTLTDVGSRHSLASAGESQLARAGMSSPLTSPKAAESAAEPVPAAQARMSGSALGSGHDALDGEIELLTGRAGGTRRNAAAFVAWTALLVLVAGFIAHLTTRERSAQLQPAEPAPVPVLALEAARADELAHATTNLAPAPRALIPEAEPVPPRGADAPSEPEPPAVTEKSSKLGGNKALKPKPAAARTLDASKTPTPSSEEDPDVGF